MTIIQYHTKEAAIAAVTQSAFELKHCSPELQNDEDVVMTALKQDSLSFECASAELKSNKAFILKALNEGISSWHLLYHSNINIHSNLEIMTLAVEKSDDGWEFNYAQGEASLNKDLAAKALVKWGNRWGTNDFDLWESIHLTLQEFFPKDCWFKKAQSYLIQLEQEKQAELVSGGCTSEDEVIW